MDTGFEKASWVLISGNRKNVTSNHKKEKENIPEAVLGVSAQLIPV